MKEITVPYMVSDENEERLKKITEKYRERGLNFSEEEMFKNIMFAGSMYDIDEKLKEHELLLGIS